MTWQDFAKLVAVVVANMGVMFGILRWFIGRVDKEVEKFKEGAFQEYQKAVEQRFHHIETHFASLAQLTEIKLDITDYMGRVINGRK